jgi:hypothetical protein
MMVIRKHSSASKVSTGAATDDPRSPSSASGKLDCDDKEEDDDEDCGTTTHHESHGRVASQAPV